MATRGQQKAKARAKKDLEDERSAKKKAPTSKELTKEEKKAETRGERRRAENREKSRAEFNKRKASSATPPAGSRRANTRLRREIPKSVRERMISPEQDRQNRQNAGDAKLRTEDRRTSTSKKPSLASRAASVAKRAAPFVRGAGPLGIAATVATALDALPDSVKKSGQTGGGQMDRGNKSTSRGKSAPSTRGGRGDGKTEVKARRAQSKAKGGSHTVKKGDTLSAIAQSAGVTVKELLAANPSIKNPDMIRPGQKIKLPEATIKGTGKSIYMNKGGMAKCGASNPATQKSSKGIK